MNSEPVNTTPENKQAASLPQQKRHKNSRQIIGSSKIGRNEKCPCGSGMKYKHCCLIRRNQYIAKQKQVSQDVQILMDKTKEKFGSGL